MSKQCKIKFDKKLFTLCAVTSMPGGQYFLNCPNGVTVYFVPSQKQSFCTMFLGVSTLLIHRDEENRNIVVVEAMGKKAKVAVESDAIYLFKNKEDQIAVTLNEPRGMDLILIEEAVR